MEHRLHYDARETIVLANSQSLCRDESLYYITLYFGMKFRFSSYDGSFSNFHAVYRMDRIVAVFHLSFSFPSTLFSVVSLTSTTNLPIQLLKQSKLTDDIYIYIYIYI